jgi:hypothetical protein
MWFMSVLLFFIAIHLLVFGMGAILLFANHLNIMEVRQTKEKVIYATEQAWREQARTTLKEVGVRFDEDVASGALNPNDRFALQEWCKKNISGLRNGGPTGDGFVIEIGSEIFIWDGSPDCAKPIFIINGRYMKDEAQMHQRPDLAEKALDLMRLGVDTTANDNYYWQFDDSKELLEWIVKPSGMNGFNGEPRTIGGVNNTNYSKILIQLGTQEDEILKPYQETFDRLEYTEYRLILVSVGVVIFYVLLMGLYIFYTKRQGVDDNAKAKP